MGEPRMFEKLSKESPELLEEFDKKHCQHCGTQRCLGVYDELWREGCTIWQELQKERRNEAVQDKLQGTFSR